MASTFAPYAPQHVTTKGPGDSRPTALQIIEDEGLVGKLTDKVMLITGCSSGIGPETARALHATGATLFLQVRNLEKGEAVVKDILATSLGKGNIELLRIDLDSLESVRAGAAEFLKKSDKLNVLVNNAGERQTPFHPSTQRLTPQPGVMHTPEGTTTDGFETQWATNHLSHFVLTNLLLPTLIASSTPSFRSRVVSVSSMGHRYGPPNFSDVNFAHASYDPWQAYANSKTANILFANAIERRYGRRGVHATSVYPGGIKTGLQGYVDEATKKAWEAPEINAIMKSAQQGAATQTWAAVGRAWEGRGGKYLEDVALAEETKAGFDVFAHGYSRWAFDEGLERECWDVSAEQVGLKEGV